SFRAGERMTVAQLMDQRIIAANAARQAMEQRAATDRVYTGIENARLAIASLTIPPPSVTVTVNADVSIRDVHRRTTATLRVGRLTAQ
ncbi:MAG: hypothetical protein AAB922_02230, partial [Patescibacteria group bacterium]